MVFDWWKQNNNLLLASSVNPLNVLGETTGRNLGNSIMNVDKLLFMLIFYKVDALKIIFHNNIKIANDNVAFILRILVFFANTLKRVESLTVFNIVEAISYIFAK